MPAFKATVHLVHRNGLPEDEVVNTFHFSGAGGNVGGDEQAIAAALDDAYNSVPAGMTVSLGSIIGSQITRVADACRIEVYRAPSLPLPRTPSGNPSWGSPTFIDQFTLDPLQEDTGNLPSEVAGVLSVHGNLTGIAEEAPDGSDPGSAPDRPRARRRGRIYFGPWLRAWAVNQDPDGTVRFGAAGLLAAVGARLKASGQSMSLPWCVYSDADRTFHQIVGGFADNAFDIQRRRGEQAGARTLFT